MPPNRPTLVKRHSVSAVLYRILTRTSIDKMTKFQLIKNGIMHDLQTFERLDHNLSRSHEYMPVKPPPYKATQQSCFQATQQSCFREKMLRKLAFFPHTMEKVRISNYALPKSLIFAEFKRGGFFVALNSANGVAPNYSPHRV